ncbi:sulfurtransferase complex subunit TusC [Marinobacterium arenosum]|uniref:sulfurtransferase complex subunit TusC n=1 Tax=Marinobacterium arenosum TaxID=2862496 RepID=UPI001C974D08|nr:sulfurtransferase complex subunit TusC [Marinobacterium arenosum]MBY4677193.1 sulfurtransferase complex subunit TusC [Marinobacterium arenosum]
MSTKSFLIINRRPPYASNLAREALDSALTVAVFEQPVAILFLSDAVYQLLPDQQPAAIGQKSLAANLQVLPMYDIEQLYVSARALAERGLSTDQLAVPVTELDDDAVQTLIKQHDVVLNF